LAEIAAWSSFGDGEKRAVLAQLPARLAPVTAPEPECIGICNPEPLSGKCEGCGRQLQPPAEFDD
jgi:predicted Fe-S protein YdhL (DUF1289 family)